MDAWDICAGVALVTAAGVTVTDMSGEVINFSQDKVVPGLITSGPGL